MLDLYECQKHKWYPDIGGNLQLPEEDRAYCVLTELNAPETLALSGLDTDTDKANGVFDLIDGHLEDAVNFSWKGAKITRGEFLNKVSAARLAEMFAFLQAPVSEEDLVNLGVPSSGI